jgi:type IV pilus assembly protein PilY1
MIIEGNIMKTLSRNLKTAALFCCLASFYYSSTAEDIDIFTGASGGAAAAPNVMFLLDNSTNWASNATNTCATTSGTCPTLSIGTYNSSSKVGGNELNAMIVALNSLYTAPGGVPNIAVGLATFTEKGSNQYGFVRFGARNIADTTTDPTTGKTAYASLISLFSGIDPNTPTTKVNVGNKDESESLFELYQYYKSAAPGTGLVKDAGVSGSSPSLADYPGNTNSGAGPMLDATGANYTAYNLASCGATNTACLYRGPAIDCSQSYIIYIVNHDHSNNGSFGARTYNGVTATADISPAVVGGVTGENRWIVEWADFLFKNNITLYVVDVGGDATATNPYSIALQQAAKVGGGKYFALPDSAVMTGVGSLASDLTQIFIEIQAVNSTFASVSLPINATTRSQDLNQVFIPMFRPDPDANPLWKGNLKQYQLKLFGSFIELADFNGIQAVNANTGFATPCAQSYWTSDSSTYWANVTENPSPKGTCSVATQWSDSPDGSMVEKGGVAEVIRKGNNPPSTNTSPTWNLNRTIYTQPLAGGALTTFSSASTGLNTASGLSGTALTDMANFIRGQDINAEYNSPPPPGIGSTPAALTRPSLHGDTIHSQPLPVSYTNTSIYVYYGSNDGMLRAINATTGQEQWAFVAPEFYSRLNRLKTQSPLILYPNQPTSVTPTPTKKDYFFDGSIGLYQTLDNSSVWIYPTMRRGGRTIYSFDVANPASPVFKWKVGCPNLTDDLNCVDTSGSWPAANVTSMAQTWSIPNVAAAIQGYSTGPVVVVGGGYNGGKIGANDVCDDQNLPAPTCDSKGASVNVIDANTGALIKSFSTGFGRSVAADVALLSSGTNTGVDHAYAVDTGGNIFRIDFKTGGPSTWEMNRVAYTNGSGRKFLFPPALFQNPGTGFVYLALGSGDREHPLITQYPYTTPVLNRFYVYRDSLASTSTTPATNLDSGSNVIQVSPTQGCLGSNPSTNTINQTTIGKDSTSNVYYLNLNQYGTGEQTVTSALIISGMVTFSTNRPVPATLGTCASSLGEARGYFLNLLNGSGAIGVGNASCGGSLSATFVGGGLPPSPVFANVAIGNTVYQVVIGAVQRNGGANSPIAPQNIPPVISAVRNTKYVKTNTD